MEVDEKIVISRGVRTPFGHIGKSLSEILPEELLAQCIRNLITMGNLHPEAVDGVITGWVGQGSHAPNIARVASLLAELPNRIEAFTVQANCVSGIEAVCSAARRIKYREGDLFIAAGTESMSTFPFAIRGTRTNKILRTYETLIQNWNSVLNSNDIAVIDTIEEGLTDPYVKINMAETAEIVAQLYSISKEEQDEYAYNSFKKTYEAWERGFYKSHVMPFKKNNVLLERDEYVYLRKSLVENPQMIKKAPLLFERSDFSIKDFYDRFKKYIPTKNYIEGKTTATVTFFNSVARSDGAGCIIVTSEKHARELNLEILAEISGWGFYGTNPAYMGISPAFAVDVALKNTGLDFNDINAIEIHEAFAATVLATFKVGEEKFGHKWRDAYKSGIINPNGGSLAIGHPLATTGIRIILNLVYRMKENPSIKYGLACACAAGGLGGAIILKRYG